MIFQNPKKFQNITFRSKVIAILKYLRIFKDFRSFTNKMYGKTHIEFTVELCERF